MVESNPEAAGEMAAAVAEANPEAAGDVASML